MDLVIDKLTKRFGERVAVEIPSLTVRAGEFFTFVGPSGCGKSTTLNLIAGLEQASAGTLRLGERALGDLPPHRRNVAFVFQSYALYPHRTVFRNLSFPLELAGTPRAELRARVEQAAGMLGLTPLLDKYPRQLSGGERQRVALGRAIVRQPELFLLDEPLSNLDAPLRAQMRKELKRLHQQLGITFLYVTHDQEEALSLSDRIAVMNAGRIVQCAAPREVYDQPADTFVARFFGSPPMNLLSAELVRDAAGAWVQFGGARLRLNPTARLLAGPVTLGVRPEHIRLSHDGDGQALAAEVALAELHGGQSYLDLQGEGFSLMAVAPAEEGYARGERVSLSLPPERLHWFDAESGRRIPAEAE
jgi:multiple sugar transport system ATP-binding protein